MGNKAIVSQGLNENANNTNKGVNVIQINLFE
jgi:hypothetical protein